MAMYLFILIVAVIIPRKYAHGDHISEEDSKVPYFPELRRLINATTLYKEHDKNKNTQVIYVNLVPVHEQYYRRGATSQKGVPKMYRGIEGHKLKVKEMKEERTAQLVGTQHARKLKELKEFMEGSPTGTNYLYEEMIRIRSTRKIKDEFKDIIDYIESHPHCGVGSKVLKCLDTSISKMCHLGFGDGWGVKTNNLIIKY